MKDDAASPQANRAESALESRARASMEKRVGSPLDDEAWKVMGGRLIEFVLTLQRWNEQQKTSSIEDRKCNEPNKPAA